MSASAKMRIWRRRAPVRLTSPTPSTVSSTRLIFLSAISVVSRRLRSPATTTETTGSESGSAFWMIGGRMFGGRSRSAPATFSRTSWAALSISRSSTNWQLMRAVPACTCELTSSMPLIVESASSRGRTTCVVISSGVEPGSLMLMLTVAGSARGKRSTPRSRNEKIPSTPRKAISMTANTARLTHSSARVTALPIDGGVIVKSTSARDSRGARDRPRGDARARWNYFPAVPLRALAPLSRNPRVNAATEAPLRATHTSPSKDARAAPHPPPRRPSGGRRRSAPMLASPPRVAWVAASGACVGACVPRGARHRSEGAHWARGNRF